MFGWTQGWSFLFGLSTLLISFPFSIGIERGLADKREMEELLEKLRDGGNGVSSYRGQSSRPWTIKRKL